MVDRDEKEAQLEEAKKVRKIGLKELARDFIRAEPSQKPSKRRKITPTDPYFALLDQGREFMLWVRKQDELRKKLPKQLGTMIIEMEQLMAKMHSQAISDGYDYSANYNSYYFDMVRAESLIMGIRYHVGKFMQNEKLITKCLGEKGSRSRMADADQISRLGGIAEMLETSIKGFISSLERDYGLGEAAPVLGGRKDDTQLTRKGNDES